MKTAYFLSGEPGCGKTSAIKLVLARVGKPAGGFYTEEIRSQGVRGGFRIVTLDGGSAVLADTAIRGAPRVGKYGVNLSNVDTVAAPSIENAIRECDVVVIDEIGKMELFSEAFRGAVLAALGSGKRVLGTIMLAPHPWADNVKRRPEVEVVALTRANRDEVVEGVAEWLSSPG
jgi:nucleoside-triphosphatase